MQVFKNVGATTTMNLGFAVAPAYNPSGSQTMASADDAVGAWLALGTRTNTVNDDYGISSNSTLVRPGWNPEVTSYIRVDLGAITSVRYWSGWSSADPGQSATPTAALAAFRYDSSVDTGATWRAVTSNTGSAVQTVTNTGVPVTIGGRYRLRVDFIDVGAAVEFYIDDVLVATHTTNLPSNNLQMGWMNFVTTLSTARRSLLWSRTAVMHD